MSPLDAPPPPPVTRAHWLPLLAVCLGTFMLLVDVTIVNVALPDMALDLGASFSGLQWVVDVYALALAALLMLVGSLSDIVGRRRSYLAGLGAFTVASLACGFAPNETALIAARAVQGVGAAAMFATTIALLNTAYRGRDRSIAFGMWGATAGAASAAGPIAGGLLTQGLSWRWIFFVNVPIGIVTILLARRALAESRLDHRPRIDWAGGATFTLAAGALVFALVRVIDEGWTSAATLGPLALAAVALATFVAIELRTREPMLDLSLLRRRSFVGILVGSVVLSASAFGTLVCLSIWLQTVLELSPISAGLVTLPLSGLAFVVAAAGGRLLHGVSPRWVIGTGLVLIGAGDLLMSRLGADSGWTSVLPGLAVLGIGVGLTSPVLVATAMASVPQERGGMAAGAINTGRQLGLAVGIAILGSIFSTRVASLLAGGPGDGLGHAVASGGSQGLLSEASGVAQVALDASIRTATGGALGTVFLIAGAIGVLGGLLVIALMREPAAERDEAEAAARGSSTRSSSSPTGRRPVGVGAQVRTGQPTAAGDP